MENLRWILIFAGVAILVLLYVSGRSSAAPRRRDARTPLEPDPLLADARETRARGRGRAGVDPIAGRPSGRTAEPAFDAFDAMDPEDLERPAAPVRGPRRVAVQRREPVHDFESVSSEDFEPIGYADAPPRPEAPREPGRTPRPEPGRAAHDDPRGDAARDAPRDAGYRGPQRRDPEYGAAEARDGGTHGEWDDEGRGHGPDDRHPGGYGRADGHGPDGDGGYRSGRADEGSERVEGGTAPTPGGLGGLGRRLGARFGAGRRAEAAAEEAPARASPSAAPATKVVTLHVVARDGDWFDGGLIAETFEARGYAFGEMDIFHSMHRGTIVFSIAKMIVPGSFDPDDLDSFATPGLVLILQLPGPVPPDAACEVLLSEAHELAMRLDGRVLDGERSTLSKQSAQHLRDGIKDFMHRQKYFGGGVG